MCISMDDVEIPKYFICPISLQIMKDPVTTVTGITYGRESIEHWRSRGHNKTCPVTNQPLPPDSVLTPNHTLRRLIQSWCTSKGISHVQINPPLKKSLVITLLRNLRVNQEVRLETLKKLEFLAAADEGCNMICLQQTGVDKAMGSFIEACHKNGETVGLKEALSVLYLVGTNHDHTRLLLKENEQLMDSLAWVLGLDKDATFKIHAVLLLKLFIDKANSGVLERLKRDFFEKLVLVLKEGGTMSQLGIRAALDIMLSSCSLGRNRVMMVEAGAVFELIELGLTSPEKSTIELIFGVLIHLCSCADGRDQLLSHAAGLAFISEKMLTVSPKADDRIMFILSLVSMFSGTIGVLLEMLKIGIVSKLCMALQYDHASYFKEKAREILRSHSNVWINSDCIEVSKILARYTRS